MAVNKTSLSAGLLIREILLDNQDVSAITKHVFPLVTDKADLPYILYRRSGMSNVHSKNRSDHNDTIQMDIICFTATYAESIALAEAVRAALDGIEAVSNDKSLSLRSCDLIDAQETWEDNAFMQSLTFEAKI